MQAPSAVTTLEARGGLRSHGRRRSVNRFASANADLVRDGLAGLAGFAFREAVGNGRLTPADGLVDDDDVTSDVPLGDFAEHFDVHATGKTPHQTAGGGRPGQGDRNERTGGRRDVCDLTGGSGPTGGALATEAFSDGAWRAVSSTTVTPRRSMDSPWAVRGMARLGSSSGQCCRSRGAARHRTRPHVLRRPRVLDSCDGANGRRQSNRAARPHGLRHRPARCAVRRSHDSA